MVSDETRLLGRVIDAGFRLEILFWVVVFGVVMSYFVYGQLLTVVSQLTAVVGGGAVGVICAAALACSDDGLVRSVVRMNRQRVVVVGSPDTGTIELAVSYVSRHDFRRGSSEHSFNEPCLRLPEMS
jgi:hypothetical protein